MKPACLRYLSTPVAFLPPKEQPRFANLTTREKQKLSVHPECGIESTKSPRQNCRVHREVRLPWYKPSIHFVPPARIGLPISSPRCVRAVVSSLIAAAETEHKLSVIREANLLVFSSSSVYHLPRPTSVSDLALMRRIDELYLDHHRFVGVGCCKGF